MAKRPLLFRLFELGARAVKEPVKEASENLIENAKDSAVSTAKVVGKTALDYTIFVLIGLVGYVFMFLGLAFILRDSLGLAPALLIIGGVHVIVGVTGVVLRSRRKQEEQQPNPEDPAMRASETFAPVLPAPTDA